MMRTLLITLFILTGIAVASGFAMPMAALQVANTITPIFGALQ